MKSKLTNYIRDEFVYGGHLAALMAPAIISTMVLLLDIDFGWVLLAIGYLLALTLYRYNYYAELDKDVSTNPERSRYMAKYSKLSQLIIAIGFVVIVVLAVLFTNLETILFSVLLIVAGIAYTRWLKGFTTWIPGFKDLYVSLTWSLLAILPGFYYWDFTWSLFVVFIFVFLRAVLNNVFFDIKDVMTDKVQGLKTIPVLIGEKKTLRFLHLVNFVSFAPLIIGVLLDKLPSYSLVMLVFVVYDFYYLRKAQNKSANISNLSYIVADGEFLLWPAVALIGRLAS